MNKEITLEEFKLRVEKQTEEFFKFWHDNSKADPNTYPDKLLENDWWEGFNYIILSK